jgi:glutaredoxin-dependent peroxiredoxin
MNNMKIEVGSIAPDFSLYSSDKEKVSLGDYKDKNVVLLFFPLAFTGVCTKELCNIRDNIGIYNNSKAKVLAISVDSPQTLAKFKEDQKLNFQLLSDFNKTVSEKYGCLYETFSLDMKGVSKRSAFVIDQEGIIRYAEVLENASREPDYEAIEKCLEVLN